MTYTLVRMFFKYFLYLWGTPVIIGKENIPQSGPVIVVANHTSLLDGFLLASFWPHRLTFLSAGYLFRLPIVGTFLRTIGAIPVQNEASELAGMRTALRALQKGKTLALFPEGRVCNQDEPYPFQPGWAYLALKTGVPVVPVAIKGTRTVLPVGSVIPHRGKIYIQIAAPLTLKKVQRPRQEILEDLNMRLFGQIEQMLKSM